MNRLHRIALATYAAAPALAPDDRLLIPAFAALGVEAVPAVWNDPAVDWTAFDAVMIRSCWDYHLHSGEFLAWVGRLVVVGRRVWNSPRLVRWNADKRYLLDLAARGVPTVPTFVIRRGESLRVAEVVAEQQWPRFVLKPAVSASGYETHLLPAPVDADARITIERVTALGDSLVQPFVDEVARDGEFSFTFIDGAFSHATLKRPALGEFRVQPEHGGTAEEVRTNEALAAGAARVLAALPEVPLYARVDGVAHGGSFELMELELIEPNLFLEYGNAAVARLAAAAVTRFASR